jgi:hypothetical protein
MKDTLLDIISHTHSLGFIKMLKITSDNSTVIESMTETRSVVMTATTHVVVKEFKGIFGMPDLHKLAFHLKNPEYKENAKIEVKTESRAEGVIPTHMYFENESGDFSNEYRFMKQSIIEDKLKSARYKGSAWTIVFEPTVASIQRLSLMSNAHNEETVFQVKTENKNLNFYFGDLNTHAGQFTFQSGITGKLTHTWAWPILETLKILELAGDKTMSFNDQGAMKISVDSGLALYEYILPAQQK